MEKKLKTAIVIGATGLVGSQLVSLLLEDENYDKINIFVRRTTGVNNPKLHEHIVDFTQPDEWRHLIKGDVLFSAMGTTIKQAGSKAHQYEIDYNYQYNTAVTAATNGVKDYVLVSAIGAKTNSSFFYNRMKGELEDAVKNLPFRNITIIRPGLLYGARKEKRTLEEFGFRTLCFLNRHGFMKNRTPIHGKEVAQAMLYAESVADGICRHVGNDLFTLAAKYGR